MRQEGALRQMNRYLKNEITDRSEFKLAAEAFFKYGDWVHALEIYEQHLHQDPSPDVLAEIAEFARDRNDFETAERAYRFAVNQNPKGEERERIKTGLRYLIDRIRLTGRKGYLEQATCLLSSLDS